MPRSLARAAVRHRAEGDGGSLSSGAMVSARGGEAAAAELAVLDQAHEVDVETIVFLPARLSEALHAFRA